MKIHEFKGKRYIIKRIGLNRLYFRYIHYLDCIECGDSEVYCHYRCYKCWRDLNDAQRDILLSEDYLNVEFVHSINCNKSTCDKDCKCQCLFCLKK